MIRFRFIAALLVVIVAWVMCGCSPPPRSTHDCAALPGVSKALHACIDAVGREMNVDRCEGIAYRYNELRQACPVTP